jgi:uncharacterized protein (TIGR02001 family)
MGVATTFHKLSIGDHIVQKTLLAVAIAACLVPTASFAEDAAAPAAAAAPAPSPFTGNVMIASEYLYRGLAQTNGKLAIQGGFDYAHPSGFYVGTWGSNISWLSDVLPGAPAVTAPIELDIYGGYKNSFAGGDWNYDVGVLTYNYPGTYPTGFTKADTTEIYGLIGWKWLSLKYSDVVSSHIFGIPSKTGGNTNGSGYLDLSANYDLGNGLGINAHVGHQSIKDNSILSYSDWKFGVTKDLGIGTVGLYLSDTNAKGCKDGGYCDPVGNRDMGKSRAVLSFSKTL